MSKKLLQAAAGAAAGEALYVEDVFSTYLYTGNSSTQTITNGIDLDGEGGLVWQKSRSNGTYRHRLTDTARGAGYGLSSDATDGATSSSSSDVTGFTSSGFSLGYVLGDTNLNGQTYASWTFRKAPKFFDVVTYTGTGSGIKVIDHNLGSAPAVIFVKKTNSSQDWLVFSKDTSQPHNKYLKLNTTDAELNYDNIWGENGYLPTDTQFKVQHLANESSSTYVAYLFASDAGGFGDDENIIKCGSYTGNGSTTGPVIDLGFEPQWLLVKRADSADSWNIVDNMRGFFVGDTSTTSNSPRLRADLSDAEQASGWVIPTSTGFQLQGPNAASGSYNASGGSYIYIAIRRPMKTPESGTEVFKPIVNAGATAGDSASVGFAPDMTIFEYRTAYNTNYMGAVQDRLRGYATANTSGTYSTLTTPTNYSETALSPGNPVIYGINNAQENIFYGTNASTGSSVVWAFKRATGFFDVVAYTGDGASSRNINHNLGAVPELMIRKTRNNADNWQVYSAALTNEYSIILNTSAAAVGPGYYPYYPTEPTDTVFTVGNAWNTNSYNMIVYLFATLAGVSKVGSYTGTGSNVDVDCGFSAGARFVLIKRTDSTGDWYVWDSERGIVAGNDPYLLLNSTAAEVTSTDYIDPLSSGFTVTSSAPAALNASGGTYIFLAIS